MNQPAPLMTALEGAGFFIHGQPAPGLVLGPSNLEVRTTFKPDAIWGDRSNVQVVFKYADRSPSSRDLAYWHRDVWNLGVAPLLWVVSPQRIDLYNTYERPLSNNDAANHLLRQFRLIDEELEILDDYAGRLAMASGAFWTREDRIRRDGRVDVQLLKDLREVERKLCAAKLPRAVAQALIGRCIFVCYLTDRQLIPKETLQTLGLGEFQTVGLREFQNFGIRELSGILRDHSQAYRLFEWVGSTFNGDLFPITATELTAVKHNHLRLVAETLAGTDPTTGQMSLWPYRFDVIPIELISSIYEQFASGTASDNPDKEGIHYTPITLVNLILDEVMRNASHKSRVLDLTCGSGVFLVEALRRLVYMRAAGNPIKREDIREVLRDQIFGVDKNEYAISVAAFSLYLAALELDRCPTPSEALKFEALIGRNLFIADAFELDRIGIGAQFKQQPFDIIVGNPPWTYRGKSSRNRGKGKRKWPPLPPRSQDFAFVWRSLEFSHGGTRLGIVMRATPFFSSAQSSVSARNALIEALAQVVLVNLSALRDELFPTADYPAMVLLARVDQTADSKEVAIVTVQWTQRFSRSGTFEIAPSDVHIATRADIESSTTSLKAIALGTPRDRLLLRRITHEAQPLSDVLESLKVELLVGIQTLVGDRNDASHLVGMPFLEAGSIALQIHPRSLPKFNLSHIHRPRKSSAFRGPLVLIGEGLNDGRVSIGLSPTDVVYTRSFYGISFADAERDMAPRLAGVLLSAVTSWQLLLTAAEFGIHKRKLLLQDIQAILVPSDDVLRSSQGAAVADAFRELSVRKTDDTRRFVDLDSAVFELYGLAEDDRLVVLDGLERARREYAQWRSEADQPVSEAQLRAYAKAFLRSINAWRCALQRKTYSGEIVSVRSGAPLRVLHFFDGGAGDVRRSQADADLSLKFWQV
jgi:hypothetical protein